MNSLPCRRVLYPYETRVFFILVGEDQADKAREIGELLKQSDVAIDRLYTTPETHTLGSHFWHGLNPEAADENDRICEVEEDETIERVLEDKADGQVCDGGPELLPLIPAEIRGHPGCHTYAVAPKRPLRIRDASKVPTHLGEYIIDQRSGQTQLHWLM
ncbi:MAG TPA: hypothetical protein PLG50_07970 [bacterium]|nr:hypothetical protein [bacterium]HQG45580.1 hypothetical protein [bacterium]HQI47116.1 hypothetical protein [bacterium]HQJ63166.1 hypothetical protein [bacterium]